MKNLCIRTIIGSFRRDCVLIILLQLYGSEAGLFESNLFYLSGLIWPTPLNLHIGRRTKVILIYLIIQLLTYIHKIISSQKTADIIL